MLQYCKFILSKIGDKQLKILFGNYHRKYHPKNCSLTFNFNQKFLQHIKMSPNKWKKLTNIHPQKIIRKAHKKKLLIIEIQKDQKLKNKL